MSIPGINNNDTIYADAVGGSQMGKEAFMELLVQQLKNQDPLSPMGNDKFIAQLTQLSSLEGIQNLNDNMVGLAMLQQGNALMSQLTQSSGSMVFFGCEVLGSHVYGDHTIYIGLVKEMRRNEPGAPLMFYNSRWYNPAED